MDERDYELIGEEEGTDPAAYGVLADDGEGKDEPTEFGMKPGAIPEEEPDAE